MTAQAAASAIGASRLLAAAFDFLGAARVTSRIVE